MSRSIEHDSDQSHVRILSILHYIFSGWDAFGGSIPLIHFTVGIAILSGAFDGGRNPPPPLMGVIFTSVGGSISLLFWSLAIMKFFAARCLRSHTGYRYCQIVAMIECVQFPLGPALGIFTLIVLSRPRVKMLFDGIESPTARECNAAEDDVDDREPARTVHDDGAIREGEPR